MQPRLLVTDILKESLYTFVQIWIEIVYEVEQEIKYYEGAYNEEAENVYGNVSALLDYKLTNWQPLEVVFNGKLAISSAIWLNWVEVPCKNTKSFIG